MNHVRPSWPEYYLSIAAAVAQRSTCLRRRYGAVIVKNGKIVSTGYNGSPRGVENCCDRGICPREEAGIPSGQYYEKCASVHAEGNALLNASREETEGAVMYIHGVNAKDNSLAAGNPCMMCNRLLINAGISKVVVTRSEGGYEGIDYSNK